MKSRERFLFDFNSETEIIGDKYLKKYFLIKVFNFTTPLTVNNELH